MKTASESETKAGSLAWLLATLQFPDYPADVHAYGTVIGTGNAVVEWDPDRASNGAGSAGGAQAAAAREAAAR